MGDTTIPGDVFGMINKDSSQETPSAGMVNRFHTKDDADSSVTSHHHTLGTRKNQASKGDHIHDGENGLLLMSGITVTGAKGGNAALADLITKLSNALGFTDGTT